MPNDIPDWTGKTQVGLVGGLSGQIQGDVSAATLAPDAATESASGVSVIGSTAVLASFKALATFAPVKAGTAITGNATGVNPLFGQATTAGNFLWAGVTGSASGTEPTTAAAGWVKVVSASISGGWAAIWCKPNCGAAEAAPQFTGGGAGLSPMQAQLIEFSGAVLTSPADRTASAGSSTQSVSIANSAADVAFGDLVTLVTHYSLSGSGAAGVYVETFNNGAAAVQAGAVNSDFSGQGRSSVFTYAIIPAAGTSQPLGVAPWAYDVSGTNSPAVASGASVVLAATPGKTYTCHTFLASAQTTANAALAQNAQLLDGATALFTLQEGMPPVAGNKCESSLVGLAYKGTIGNSMTAKFGGGAASVAESINIGAYLR